jgi:capsular exopolysaccharide synthesis family protein
MPSRSNSNSISISDPYKNNGLEEFDEINFKDIFRTFVHHQKLIFYCTLVCFLIGVLYAFLSPKTFEAVTTVKVPESTQATQNAIRQMAFMPSMGDPIETFVQMAKSHTVAELTIDSLQLTARHEFHGLSKEQLVNLLLKGTIQVDSTNESNIINIQAHAPDAQLAADLANAWAQNFIQMNLDLSRQSALSRYQFIDNQLKEMKAKLDEDKSNKQNYLDPSNEAESDQVVYKMLLQQDQETQIEAKAQDPGIVVVDKAEVPEKPIKPKKGSTLILGLLIGLFVGLQAAFWLEKIQDRVKTEEDLSSTGLTPLALIPNFRQKDGKTIFSPTERFSPKHLIDNHQFDHSPYQESFNIFRTNLTFSQVDKKLQVLSVLSANPEEGKTLVNADLALSLSHTGKKVLLIDADIRKSSISSLFGITVPPKTGLPMLLAGKGSIEKMIIQSGFANLWLLPNNVVPPNPSELLGSETMKHLVQNLKNKFDYIVIDGSPILPVTDSVVLSTALDGVVLMARWNKTRRAEVKRALRLLRAVNAPLLGTVLNSVDIKKDFYGNYGYGYGYGAPIKETKKTV